MRKRITSIIISVVLLALLVVYIISLDGGGAAPAADGVRINEIMTSNKGSVPDTVGGYPDWIELYNASGKAADISGYGLSDSLIEGAKYVFPANTVLEAGGYVVVYCGGEATTDMHAPFKLSADEEAVLFDASGKTLDSATLMAVASGRTLARQGDGTWIEMQPSPGYENSEAGIAAYEQSLMETEDIGLYINEFMASNATTILDSFGSYSDWIELFNSTSSDIDVSGFGISDTLSQPMKYQLPEGTSVPAGGYLVVFCSGNSGEHDGEIHAPFGLRAYAEDVVLSSNKGRVLDSYSYTRQEADVSMARTPDGTGDFAPCSQPTPGYPNSSTGYLSFTKEHSLPLGAVYISEFSGNSLDGKDWVELHNSSGAPVSLAGFGLSDNPKNPAKWVFPNISIDAGEYLTLYATGDNLTSQKKNLHLNFSISASGETLFLFDPDGKLVDKLCSGSFSAGMSYGRSPADERLYYTSPTQGAANGAGYAGVTETPLFLTTPGVFDSPQEVTLQAAPDEKVYYTLDCTEPSASSSAYSGPISVSKNTVIRAVAVKDGFLTGASASGTYLFTTDGVNHALPIACLVTAPDNLWNDETGIYAYGAEYDSSLPYGDALTTANYAENGDDWERAASFELFEEGGEVFSQNVGISIAGAYGRGRAQKGFNVIARDEYGANRLNYKFFDDREFESYKALVLRAGAQDQNRSKIRDELAAAILKGTDVNFLYQAYRPLVLYLNGEYWGVYFMKEKRNRFFIAQHEGTENVADMDIAKASTRVSYGTNKEWLELMAYIGEHSLSSQANYDYVAARLDVNSFMDYMVCELYTGNSDYGNIQYYKLPNGKWKWIYYDFCWGFSNYDHQTVTLRRGTVPAASSLFNALLENAAWKDAFCRRFGELLKTSFTPERVKAAIAELNAAVEPEIAREREKFNGESFRGVKQPAECLGSYDSFQRQIQYLQDFADKRPAAIKANLKAELGLSDSYMQEVFG